MRKAFLPACLILSCASPSVAAPSHATPGPGPVPAPFNNNPNAAVPPPRADMIFGRLRSEIIELRAQAIALQASDGGRLTTEHRDFIQTRIDAAYHRYHVARRREGSAL